MTLGCSKNTVDSEKLLKQAEAAGYSVVFDSSASGSDIVIVNTCGFINDAKEQSVDTILDFARAKKAGEIESLYVMGCLSERYMDDLRGEIPEVDSYFGVNSAADIIRKLGSSFRRELEPERIITGPGYYAYLKISEGCDRTCAFCAIPGIRGKYRSRSIEDLSHEASRLASAGVKELILIAQDLSYYGLDLYKKQMLTELVSSLCRTEGIEWIRLHYLYPANFPTGLIELMKREPKVCRYIDLPVQHISDNVLSRMRRSHSSDETRKLLEHIRRELPGVAIRTTLIVGHPGETGSDFEELTRFVDQFRFDRLGVFTYSHEEDTYGFAHYDDDVPEEVKRARADSIMELQQQISSSLNEKLIGSVMEVIIDRREGLYYYARSRSDSPEVDQEILIPANKHSLSPGTITDVTITGSSEFDLVGEIK